jgi:hypothetical protein
VLEAEQEEKEQETGIFLFETKQKRSKQPKGKCQMFMSSLTYLHLAC